MESSSVKRRLTAILAADAVGYSRHTSADEEGTLRVLAAHRAVIDGIIAFHDGRIVSTAGDSVLAEFASAVEAVRCAVEIQDALKTRNESLPDSERLPFRIGVNLGDVVVKNDDLLGDGVNVAARLEGIAEPGGVCISSSVYDQITGKLNLGFEDIGEQNLKNISRPIRAYRLAGTGAPKRPATTVVTKPHRGPVALWMAAAAVVIAAAVGFGAWKAGWLGGSGARDDKLPGTASVSTAGAGEAAKAKAAADETTAARAKIEEELARARGDAEAMKRAAESELARARAEADASRSARIKADAEAAAARAREEANAMKRAAEIELAKAEQARKSAEADAEKARLEQARLEQARAEQARKEAEAAAAARASAPTVAAVVPTPPNTVYDGTWRVTRSCEDYQEVPRFTDEFVTRITDGTVQMERGQRGQPGYMVLRGTVASDGALALTGTVISRAKQSYGREARAKLSGTLRADSPVLTGGWGGRRCTFTLARVN